jgi:hypothetical protein
LVNLTGHVLVNGRDYASPLSPDETPFATSRFSKRISLSLTLCL